MKIENNDMCERCKVVEDAEHMITDCKKYENIRKKTNIRK